MTYGRYLWINAITLTWLIIYTFACASDNLLSFQIMNFRERERKTERKREGEQEIVACMLVYEHTHTHTCTERHGHFFGDC